MPNTFDHALVVVLAVLFPLRASTFGFRRLKLAAPDDRPRVRLSVYRQAVLIQWTLTLVALALWAAVHREWDALGLVPRLRLGPMILLAVAVGTGLALAFQRRRALGDDEVLARLRQRMERLELMLPHSREELSLFLGLAITAGVCEELLYRGYLIWYLRHWLGFIPAAGVAALIFGVGHLYQGWRGVITTGMLGVFFAALYWAAGSLFPGMLIHALIDAHSGRLMQAAYARGETPATGPAALPPVDVPA